MMDRRDIDAALSAANPVDRAALEQLELEAAEQELLAAILDDRTVVAAAPARVPAGRRRSLAARIAPLGLAAAAVATVLFVLLGSGGGLTGPPASAFGLELARLAKASPIVVVNRPAPAPAPKRHRRARPPAWVRIPVVDCRHLPCVAMTYAKAVGAGIVPPGLHVERFPAGTKLVVAPSDGR